MRVRRALICAPLMPELDRESGAQSIYDLIMFLREAGWAVSFAAENPANGERYKRLLQQRGVTVYEGFGDRLDDLISYGQLDLAIFAFWYIGERLIRKVRLRSPTTRVAVNTMDLHFLRNSRRLLGVANRSEPALDETAGAEYARELSTYASADAVFCVSPKEASLLGDLVGDPGLAHVVTDYERMPPSPLGFDERRGVLFVGNFRHPPNAEAVEFLCREVVPRLDPDLLREHPVSIVGNELGEKVLRMGEGMPGVRMVGWVPSLLPYLHRSRVAVSPLLHGAGTKRKVLQALTVGLPTVSTTYGVEGFDLVPGRDVLVADDPDEFAAAVTLLLGDRQAWETLAASGPRAVGATFDRDAVAERFRAIVERVLERTPRTVEPTPEEVAAGKVTYAGVVERVRHLVDGQLPPRSRVAVVSKGDDRLLRFRTAIGRHFPVDDSGSYAGYYPADDAAAIEQVERMREDGVDFLVFPQPALWWLDHYAAMREHLDERYAQAARDEAGVVYSLS